MRKNRDILFLRPEQLVCQFLKGRVTRLGSLLLTMALFFAAAFAQDQAPDHALTLQGKLISLPGKGPVLRAEAKDYPLAATSPYLFHTLQDKRLLKREVRLEGAIRTNGTFEVAHLYTIRGGKLYKVRYYCEVCNIVGLQPGPCVCCQQPTALQEIPVTEVGADTIVVP